MKALKNIILISILALAACSHSLFTFHAMHIRNATASTIYDVKIKVHETGSVIACNYILPDKDCALSFNPRESKGYAVEISWQSDGVSYTKIINQVNHEVQSSQTSKDVTIFIRPLGQIGVSIE